ncbi:MAG: hypothetical protein QHH30_01260 [candidate division NC10 bacterium]|nr:hypothetical protein [candidate division NC10 bacterium]
MSGKRSSHEGGKPGEVICPTCGRKVKEHQIRKSSKAGQKDFCYFCEAEVSDIGGLGPGPGKPSR